MPRGGSAQARVRSKLRRFVTLATAQEGQPATLGKASGEVFYDDGTNIHRNRVWVRMGAEDQVLMLARSEKQGLPAAAGLEVTVTERFGILYVTDWERDDAMEVEVGATHGVQSLTATQFDRSTVGDSPIYHDTFPILASTNPVWELATGDEIATSFALPFTVVSGFKRCLGVVHWFADGAGDAALQLSARIGPVDDVFGDVLFDFFGSTFTYSLTAGNPTHTIASGYADVLDANSLPYTWPVGTWVRLTVGRNTAGDTISGSVYIAGVHLEALG